MKQIISGTLLLMTLVIASCQVHAGPDDAAVKKVVNQFATYADNQNADGMSGILHAEYRGILNQLFGAKEASTMNKSAYLEMLRSKKIGGDKRKVSILSLQVTNNNASVYVKMEGSKATFLSHLLLIKSADGKWEIISDLPDIASK